MLGIATLIIHKNLNKYKIQMELISTTGRRKSSIARVFLKQGKGEIFINKKPLKEYFTVTELIYKVKQPLTLLEIEKTFDINVNVQGGGIRGQAEATTLGIARAIEKFNPEHRQKLKQEKLLTRDPRIVERKKYGQKKARKKFQFSKR